jgi:hypothetical protein
MHSHTCQPRRRATKTGLIARQTPPSETTARSTPLSSAIFGTYRERATPRARDDTRDVGAELSLEHSAQSGVLVASARRPVPTRSTRLRSLAVVELEQAAEPFTRLHRAGLDLCRLRHDEFVPETLARPLFMIVTDKFVDGRPEMLWLQPSRSRAVPHLKLVP